MGFWLLGKINGATREDSSIFSDKFKRHYLQVRVKVCNHPFTLNFLYYICVHLYLFPTAPAVKTIELFANRNISKRESNNNYTKPKFTAETPSKVTLHIYHLSIVQKQKNNHIQNSSLSLKSVHKKERKSLEIYNI